MAKNIVDGAKANVGYVVARVRVIPDIIRCYKCHHFGHMAINCTISTNGAEICRCGASDHSMDICKAQIKCRLRAEAKLPLNKLGHIAGGISCPQYNKFLESTIARAKGSA